MKQTILIILVCSLILGLCACSNENTKIEEPVKFYYCTVKDAENQEQKQEAILAEVRETNHYKREDLEGILNLYFKGPLSDNLQSLFPANTRIVNIIHNENAVFITLNEDFANLTGIDLSLACACIGLTVFDYTNVQILSIEAENNLLDNKSSITLLRENLLLNDNTDIPTDIG